MKLIVGLGNPGEKYTDTRHNLGFRVVDELVASSKEQVVWEESKKFKAQIAKTSDLIFVKPLTFMNLSGLSISALAAYYKLPTTDIIVIHDELDLPLGKIKVRMGGSAAGHHGVESIIKYLGTDKSRLDRDKFIRVRVGIGSSAGSGLIRLIEHGRNHVNAEKFVLEEFEQGEKPKVKKMIKNAVEAVELILKEGIEKTQNQYN